MEIKPEDVGKIVWSPQKPHWGVGKIREIIGKVAVIRFIKDIEKKDRKFSLLNNSLLFDEKQSLPKREPRLYPDQAGLHVYGRLKAALNKRRGRGRSRQNP